LPHWKPNTILARQCERQPCAQGQIKITGASVVTRDLNGPVDVKSEVGDDPYTGTATGGVIGLLVGIIGGPLGVLLGGATGILVGSHAKVEQLKSKLHRPKAGATS
jgi:uncharacterized membrane protein